MHNRHDRLKLSRRALLAGAGSFLAVGALPHLAAWAQDEAPPPNAIPPAEALERLKTGNARYVSDGGKGRDFSAGDATRVDKQYPIAGVLSSSDSPVPPAIIFDQKPGDIFVSRNAGNVVSNYTLASLEFAVSYHGIPLIFVLGHTDCSAVLTALSATVQRKQLPGHLGEIVKAMEPAVIAAHGKHSSDPLNTTVEENVRLGVKRIKKDSKLIGDAVLAGTLKVAGGVFDVKTGVVTLI